MSDLISKSVLLKAIEGVEVAFYLDNGVVGYNYDDTTIVDIIDEQPTIDAAPVVHGKWIRTHNGDGWNDWYDLECPVCGEYYKKPNFKENFCPNCGADMR